MTYRCPYPDCNQIFPTVSSLTRHIKWHHDTEYCPFCNRRFKNLLKHAVVKAKEGCEKHAALWYCLSNRSGASRRLMRDYRDSALEYLEITAER